MKKFLRMGITILMGYLLAATAAMAQTTWIVDKGGAGDFTTIQGCIDSASVVDGDTCQVNAGTYVENINFSGKNITVKSTSGPATTIIDGNAAGSVVTFENGETVNAVLDGFTIQNGNSAGNGGGIICISSSPTVTNCTFSGNTAAKYGGGMSNYGGSPTVTNCTFSENQTGPTGYGGGMWNYSASPTVTNCTFSGNTATSGGGMSNEDNSSPTVINSILWGDSPEEILNLSSTFSVTYSDVEGGYTGTGNINADPKFADAAHGDFHLRQGSPCIDAGDNSAPALPTTDIDGDNRKIDDLKVADTGNGTPPIVDMGADEYLRQVIKAMPWLLLLLGD